MTLSLFIVLDGYSCSQNSVEVGSFQGEATYEEQGKLFDDKRNRPVVHSTKNEEDLDRDIVAEGEKQEKTVPYFTSTELDNWMSKNKEECEGRF